MSSSMTHREFPSRATYFFSTALHTSPSLMNRDGHAYSLSSICIRCLKILGCNGQRCTTPQDIFPFYNLWRMNVRFSCVVKRKYLQYSSTFTIRWFLRFISWKSLCLATTYSRGLFLRTVGSLLVWNVQLLICLLCLLGSLQTCESHTSHSISWGSIYTFRSIMHRLLSWPTKWDILIMTANK